MNVLRQIFFMGHDAITGKVNARLIEKVIPA